VTYRRYYTYTVNVFQVYRGKLYPWFTDSIVARTVPEARKLYIAKQGEMFRYNSTVSQFVVRRGRVARKGDQ
jgi:hypothetical protein